MLPNETTMMALHREAWTVFQAESLERYAKDGTAQSSLIDYECQKILKDCAIHYRGGAVHFHAMFWFMPAAPWMDISGEAANIHMRSDAEHLVTTARTSSQHKQKETIHMISTLREEACSGNIHDLAYIPTQNCLADCLTRASAKADNLITAVKTRPS